MAELWRIVAVLQGSKVKDQPTMDLTAADLIEHYSSTSTDPSYTVPYFKHTAADQALVIDEPMLLDHLHHTVKGSDGNPAWFLQLTAATYAVV